MDHSKCKYSSSPDRQLTAGQGKLDYWGYFEKPCRKCAKEMKKKINT